MFKNVIVGVDGAEGGRDALSLATALRAADGALTLAHVYASEPLVWRGATATFEADRRDQGRELLERFAAEAGVDAQLRWKGSSSVGRGLHELAETTFADLLVVGSSRHGLLGRVLLGDDARAALSGAPCAVAIAPAGYSRSVPILRQVGVGYDGSPESENALSVARQLAAAHQASLSALEAVSFPAYLFIDPPAGDDLTIEQALVTAHTRVSALAGVEPHAAYGQPAEELAAYSAMLDLLVIGSRGYGPVGRLVHGSTAQQLVRSARCPLLVLTRAARDARVMSAPPQAGEAPTHPVLS